MKVMLLINRCRIIFLALVLFGCPAALAAQAPDSRAQAANRVLINYQDGGFQFMGSSQLFKVLPPSDELPAVQQEDLSGFWYELVAGDGSVRYRRIIANPVLLSFEGPAEPDAEDKTIARSVGVSPQRSFSLLVPQALPGDRLVLMGSPVDSESQREPANVLASFELFPIIN